MRRKWLIGGIVTVPMLLVVSLAAFVKAQSHLPPYRFMRGGMVAFEKRVRGVSFGRTSYYRTSVYNVRGDYDALCAAASKELFAAGWSQFGTASAASRVPTNMFIRHRAVNTPTEVIEMTSGRAEAYRGRTFKPVLTSGAAEGWVAITFYETETDPWWLRSMALNMVSKSSRNDPQVGVVHSKTYDQAVAKLMRINRPPAPAKKP